MTRIKLKINWNKWTTKWGLSIILLLQPIQISAQKWVQLPNFIGTAVDDGTGFVVGKTAYFGTGLNSWWSSEKSFYALNLENETWTEVASMPDGKERQYALGFSDAHNKGYVFGGYNGTTFLNDLWSFDPAENEWTELASLPSIGRSGMSCFVINDTAYILGGKTSFDAAINEVWAYSFATNTWVQKNNLPFGNCWRSSAVAHNNQGYLLFGRNEVNEFSKTLYSYNPTTDFWMERSDFPSLGRSHASMRTLNNELYVMFGIDSLNNSHTDLWKYNITFNSWTNLPGIPALGRRGGICLGHQNAIYYATGIDEGNVRLQQAWKYVFDLSIDGLKMGKNEKNVIRVLDLLGKETDDRPNTLLIYVYDDGSTEKVFRME